MLTILGPTACGKTALAVEVAYRIGAEIISADSRQVFRGMDIGTGKDLSEYDVHGTHVPYHLIDILDAGSEYNVYKFQNDFISAWNKIRENGKVPLLCGGTGMYIESIVKAYQLPDAPNDPLYHNSLSSFSSEELVERLSSLIKLHNHTDTETRERLERALEIQEYRNQNPTSYVHLPEMHHCIIGVCFPREVVVRRIGYRLQNRLKEGMVDEVQELLESGVPSERLMRYGLEYKHVTRYLLGECDYQTMYDGLFTDIRRFAKRQMTWFRRMERNGINIHWIDGQNDFNDKVMEVVSYYLNFKTM